jgi:vacuolar-type H+-ATPase subunit E/Vma4
MTANPNSPERLCEEILAEARRQRDELLRRAHQEAQELSNQAATDATRLREEQLERARREAARRSELVQAAVNVEVQLLRLARIESVLEMVRDRARRQLLERRGYDYAATLVALAREAAARMAGEALVVKLSPADRREFGTGLVEALAGDRSGVSRLFALAEDSSLQGGGLVMEDPEGRRIWDNRLDARLRRLWPELRRRMALQAGWVGDSCEDRGGVGGGDTCTPSTLNRSGGGEQAEGQTGGAP